MKIKEKNWKCLTGFLLKKVKQFQNCKEYLKPMKEIESVSEDPKNLNQRFR